MRSAIIWLSSKLWPKTAAIEALAKIVKEALGEDVPPDVFNFLARSVVVKNYTRYVSLPLMPEKWNKVLVIPLNPPADYVAYIIIPV